jgi:hypothetical protein
MPEPLDSMMLAMRVVAELLDEIDPCLGGRILEQITGRRGSEGLP